MWTYSPAVISPWDRPAEIQAKVREWIEAGVRLVLVAYPDSETVEAVRSLTDRRRLSKNDVLDAEDILPGLKLNIAEFFQ